MKSKNKPQESVVTEIVEQEIEFTCPVRGKVKQLVKVKKLKPITTTSPDQILNPKSIPEELDSDSDLFNEVPLFEE